MKRQAVINEIRKNILKIPLDDIKKEIAKTFFQMDSIVEVLYYGLTTGKNIILYGPGGFGKSQIVKKFLAVVNIRSQTIVGNADTEVDALLGIPNIKKLTEQSVYEIAFERTVFNNPGILILEEFLDVRPSTAAALKDILSEGGLRQGSVLIESLVSSVIICTNTNPDVLSIDTSSKAFYKERFPIQQEVSWESYSTQDYMDFLQLVKADTFEDMKILYGVLAELAFRTSNTSIVSPRIIIDAADLLDLHKDISVLRIVDGLDTLSLQEVIEYKKFVTEKSNLELISKSITSWMQENNELISVNQTLDFITEIEYLITQLSLIQSDSAKNAEIIYKLITHCSDAVKTHRNALHGTVSNTSIKRLNKMLHDSAPIDDITTS